MLWQAIHNKIRRSFSDAALNYEVLSSLHKEIGRELIRKVMHKSCARVLDVGTGTGYLANKAKFYFPEAMVVAVDLADEMVRQANQMKEGVHVLQADACALPFSQGAFDLVVSNLAYQWVHDPRQAFEQVDRVLNAQGSFCATMFGRRTMNELFETLHFLGVPENALKRLPGLDEVRLAIEQAGFENIQVDYELIKVQFIDVADLLRWGKGIGANVLNDPIFLGKHMLVNMEQYYKEHYPYFDGISATFEVLWVSAHKNNQQKI